MNFGEIWMLANAYAASILKHTIEQRPDDYLPVTVQNPNLNQLHGLVR